MAENFKATKELIRNCVLYDFRAGLKAAESYRRLCRIWSGCC